MVTIVVAAEDESDVVVEMFAAAEVVEEVRPCLVEAILLGEDEILYFLQLLVVAAVAVAALAVVGVEGAQLKYRGMAFV